MSEIIDAVRFCGTSVAIIDTLLLALQGYLVPVNSEVDRQKVIISICLPFHTEAKEVHTEILEICSKVAQDTPLTSKWRPELIPFERRLTGESQIIRDQLALVNSKARMAKRAVVSCENIMVESTVSRKSLHVVVNKCESESESFSSDQDLVEENDASSKMSTYNVPNLGNIIMNSKELKVHGFK